MDNPPPPITARLAEGFSGQRLIILPPDQLATGTTLPVVRDLQVTHIGHFNTARNHFVERKKGCPGSILIYCMAGTGHCKLHDKTRDSRLFRIHTGQSPREHRRELGIHGE